MRDSQGVEMSPAAMEALAGMEGIGHDADAELAAKLQAKEVKRQRQAMARAQ